MIRRTAALAGIITALLSGPIQAQSRSANPGPDGMSGPIDVSTAFWFSAIEDRGPFDLGTASSIGPAINVRADIADRWSVGITSVILFGDIEGTITDPFVEYWWTPRDEAQDIYIASFAGFHWGDYENAGANPFFQFADGSFMHFRDRGFFAGVEAWVPLDERWNLKGSLGWYPSRKNAEFFDTTEMHPLYSVGFGYRIDNTFSFTVLGALSPLAQDGFIVIGGVLSF